MSHACPIASCIRHAESLTLYSDANYYNIISLTAWYYELSYSLSSYKLYGDLLVRYSAILSSLGWLTAVFGSTALKVW